MGHRNTPQMWCHLFRGRFYFVFPQFGMQWDTEGVPSHRGGTGCSAVRSSSSRRRCGGPLRAAEAACRLSSAGGTWPPRLSAVLRIFSAMILRAFAHRTVSAGASRSCANSGPRAYERRRDRRSMRCRHRERSSRASRRVDFPISRQRTGTGVIRAGLARQSVETGYPTA